MLLKIVQTGHPVLRREGRTLTKKEILSPEVQQLIEFMRETMRDAPGVGLAAPQVGLPLRLAVIEDAPEHLEGAPEDMVKAQERKGVPFHVIINPKIEASDPTAVTHFEGCLSLTGFSALVPRARGVHVEALDHKGQPVKIDATGWYARILQHEIDHLHGRLYIDRMHTRSFTTNENAGRYLDDLSVAELQKRLGIEER
ncbi:MAG TPA: peptide deformylase [Myxococcales bacterium]|jgi:peptide deformylase